MRKILTISGTRADYGLMKVVYQSIFEDKDLSLVTIITGMHLSENFQSSLEEIKKDKYGQIYFTKKSRSMNEMASSVLEKIDQVITKEKPDILLLQGDRPEMLAGAIGALTRNVPIIHMSGGDYSGTIDDSIRGAISKLVHIHLTTCKESHDRLISIGENPQRIFIIGEPGIDLINKVKYIHPKDLAKEFNLDLKKPIILATFHPVVTEAQQSGWQAKQLLKALEELNYQVVFSFPNSDLGNNQIIKELRSYQNRKFIRLVPSLGSQKYLSLMKIASVMVGNSSSGILEAPSFKLPVVNIGSRQHKRLRAINVIDVGYSKKDIKKGINQALEDKRFLKKLKTCKNPYGDGQTAKKTITIIKKININIALLEKWQASRGSFLK